MPTSSAEKFFSSADTVQLLCKFKCVIFDGAQHCSKTRIFFVSRSNPPMYANILRWYAIENMQAAVNLGPEKSAFPSTLQLSSHVWPYIPCILACIECCLLSNLFFNGSAACRRQPFEPFACDSMPFENNQFRLLSAAFWHC